MRLRAALTAFSWVVVLLVAGCAGPGPKLAPVAALFENALADGRVELRYDMTGDGRADYREMRSNAGLITQIGYDADQDGQFEETVDLAAVPADQLHDLVMILDSVPAGIAWDVWDQGRLRYFFRPTRVVAPFPVMTDVSLTEFFGMGPCVGIESEYFDGKKMSDAYSVYAEGGNTPWHGRTDYWLTPAMHSVAYLDRPPWFLHELRRIQDVCDARRAGGERSTVGYMVSTSALGAGEARMGHVYGLTTVDRFCRRMVYHTRGRVRITLFSDHGHATLPSRRLLIKDRLSELGYRVGDKLERPGDVVVPEFGMVTCAAIHTHEPAQAARDAVNIEGVELTAWRDGDDGLMVLGRGSQARITHREGTFRYETLLGDPLCLNEAMAKLRQQGKLNAQGFASDADWYAAMVDGVYPDVLHRLWRAFHGLVKHTPDVLLSLQDGWYVGSGLMSAMFKLEAAHGSLRAASSYGFAATMRGPLPDTIRMEDLRAAFRSVGVTLHE